MEKIVFALLTDTSLRNSEGAKQQLSAQLSAGLGWFDAAEK